MPCPGLDLPQLPGIPGQETQHQLVEGGGLFGVKPMPRALDDLHLYGREKSKNLFPVLRAHVVGFAANDEQGVPVVVRPRRRGNIG